MRPSVCCQAASLSKAFRVKKFVSRDYNPYPIEVHYDRAPDEEDEDQTVRRVVREVFPRGNPMPKRKVRGGGRVSAANGCRFENGGRQTRAHSLFSGPGRTPGGRL